MAFSFNSFIKQASGWRGRNDRIWLTNSIGINSASDDILLIYIRYYILIKLISIIYLPCGSSVNGIKDGSNICVK
jgi:hypothetical protein